MRKMYDYLHSFYSLFKGAPKKRTEEEKSQGLVAKILLAGDHSCHMEPSEFKDSMKLAKGRYWTLKNAEEIRKKILNYKF